MSGAELSELLRRRLTWAAVLSNGLSGIAAFCFLALVPSLQDTIPEGRIIVVAGILSAIYLSVTLVVGTRWARRRGRPVEDWLESEQPATERDREAVLRQPLNFAQTSGTFWGLGAVLAGVLCLTVSTRLAIAVSVTILLGGISTAALGYLLAERICRPVTARALASGPPSRPLAPGVTARVTSAWVAATGVPVLGVVVVAVAELAGDGEASTRSVLAMVFLAIVALSAGLLASLVAARSIADPVAAVRAALARAETGDFGARVTVDDASEVGMLQAGFNSMAAGLDERERLRDLFGRHVGKEVARAALGGQAELGGEERDVAVLFVDVLGSTALAAERPPGEVVALLNCFFHIAIEVTEDHQGVVNKLEGDAALCVFGAPVARSDSAACALAAARSLRERLRRELPDVDAGIGVSAGRAVAGNVGAEHRFEYTVIGDPVNEAARLCELAKRRPERLLASEAAVARAGDGEAGRWSLGEAVTLRGRSSPTRLAIPAEVRPAPVPPRQAVPGV